MAIEQRTQQLERRCQFLTACVACLAAICLVLFVAGAAQVNSPQRLQVQSLEIVDGEGHVRLRLGKLESPPEQDVYGITLKDASGKRSIAIHDLGQVNVFTDDGSISLGAGDGNASLQLASGGMQPRVLLGARADYCELQLRDSQGKVAWRQATERIKAPREAKNGGDPFKP